MLSHHVPAPVVVWDVGTWMAGKLDAIAAALSRANGTRQHFRAVHHGDVGYVHRVVRGLFA